MVKMLSRQEGLGDFPHAGIWLQIATKFALGQLAAGLSSSWLVKVSASCE
jgi:hypothetical protein